MRAIRSGVGWIMLFKLITRSTSLISLVILARLLTPEDFGLVAIATAILGMLELLSAFNVDIALIQRQDPRRSDYDTAWTIKLLLALGIATLLALGAKPAAAFYSDPRLVGVFLVIAAGVVVESFTNIGVVKLRKELHFAREFWYLAVPKLIGFIVTIPLAILWRSYWALLLGTLAMRFFSLVMSYVVSDYRPRWSMAGIKHYFSFSTWVLLINWALFIRYRFPIFLLGKVAGPQAAGMFTVSQEVAYIPGNELMAPVNRVLLPALSAETKDSQKFADSFLLINGVTALVVLPATLGIALIAEPIVAVLLGAQWSDAAPLLELLAVAGLFHALESVTANVFYAVGKPKTLALIFSGYGGMLAIFAVAGAHFQGVTGLVWAIVLAGALSLPIHYKVAASLIQVPFVTLLATLARPVVAAAVMSITVTVAMSYLEEMSASPIMLLICSVLCGALVFSAVIIFLWRFRGRPDGPERFLSDEISRLIRLRSSGRNGESGGAL